LPAAEAQAFKRALSCFGLGRYLYDIDGEWVELDQHGLPSKIPKMPRWATPNGWLAGLRPKPKRNRHALVRANGHATNAGHMGPETNGHRQSIIVAIEATENKIGKRLCRGLLKNVARVWTPQQIQETAALEKVLAQMQGAERGVARSHAERSAKRFGGKTEDYLPIHNWFDESKAFFPDFRHRALRHHAEGIFLAQKLFGVTIVNSDGTQIPVRYVGEQHVREDPGPIPTVQDWLFQIKPRRWMYGQRWGDEVPHI
jgi:hypothetical protein